MRVQAETGYTDDVFQAKGNDTSMSFINISEDEWQPTKTIVRCSTRSSSSSSSSIVWPRAQGLTVHRS